MNLARFVSERQPSWNELETQLGAAKRRPERLGADGVRRLGELYRAAAADLAHARRRYPGDPVVRRLEELVGRARHVVYAAPSRRPPLLAFIRHGYWRLVAERPVLLLLAAVLLFGPALLSGSWAVEDPGAAIGLVPEEYRSVTEPRPEGTDLGHSAEEQTAISSSIFINNIQVSLLAFAGGALVGLGTALVLVYNGVFLGAVAGLAGGAGNGDDLFELVVAHGVLELSLIVVAGAAGLRIGWAIVDPARRTRVESLVTEARRGIAIVIGTAPWFVVAGIVEGFVTGSGFSVVTVTVVGFGLGALYWALVVALGRHTSVSGSDPVRDL
jgi:uncharacterized membrane protein SpoIIM required for sporulation